MISVENNALNHTPADGDFTVEHYRNLLQLAKQKYEVVTYADIPWGKRFVLWRHDMDYSLNRGLALAKIEAEEGVKATYFINPHSEFYNIAEASQHGILQEIISLGHDLGLHFDSAFFDIQSEQDLDQCIQQDVNYIHQLFDQRPVVFSFHNPVAAQFNCEADKYGGLINCYSKRFKSEVAYCSDSNGFWRFRRLHDVVSEAKDACLQVLTHPGWWLEKPTPPRQRIFRAIYGRAAAILRFYDNGLVFHGRTNHSGDASLLSIVKDVQPSRFELCDYLWNQCEFESLFLELWRLLQSQIIGFCKPVLIREWNISDSQFGRLLSECNVYPDGWRLFQAISKMEGLHTRAIDEVEYSSWNHINVQLMHGHNSFAKSHLESGCIFICKCIQTFSDWGNQNATKFDGLPESDSIGLQNLKLKGEVPDRAMSRNTEAESEKWERLKLEFMNLVYEAR